MNSKVYTVEEAISKLEAYCSYQERCHKEVNQKLRDMNMIPQVIDMIIVHLLDNNFLNEERFAKAFTRGKFRIKKWGNYRIIQELKRRDITKNLINSALKEITEAEYLQTFNELAVKKAMTITEKNHQKKKKKLADFLLYRGWESHLVYEKVNELFN
ncbi:RecX family transcriptional regulator [Subsaxibacter sp. CAU 1640]|uniref:regulatory protein RecX n=1 Tax=Subsaxibacter sp. CAU 1640 TaxID=2933271 RepID=UPI002003EBFF|nr:regulatory protein RecX [Subsaxibacter sp. CAU 1640]MCK7589700.1 RecX family transcriptional regulator [Subsaxibacter sp. CAU 1640]